MRAVVWRLYSAMLRPHKNSDLHCAHREHQKVRLIDSFISSFENSLLLQSLDLIYNRKNDIAVIRKSKQGYVVFYVRFLAHLSRRLTGELIVYPCSVVRPSSVVRRRPSSTISKIFSSETAWPIKAKLLEHP